jgi:2-polyprenyl-3-methyl-5-hydroxy-6-metoxy-1,4-benzoquinol methylase
VTRRAVVIAYPPPAMLSQSRFPNLWLWMQKTIGGTPDKQALALRYYSGAPRVLEIGCSVGNIADAFRDFPAIRYTGIDIDAVAIRTAQRRFRDRPNFTFTLCSLEEMAQLGERFDYVMFAGILHHVSDGDARRLLAGVATLVAPGGELIISEPEALRPTDTLLSRLFYRLEKGQHLRSRAALEALVKESGIRIASIEDCPVSPGFVKKPAVARFNLIRATA